MLISGEMIVSMTFALPNHSNIGDTQMREKKTALLRKKKEISRFDNYLQIAGKMSSGRGIHLNRLWS